MTSRLLSEAGGLRTFLIVFAAGDEPISGLEAFAGEHQVTGAQLTSLGACERVIVGFFDLEQRDSRRITFDEQMEVLSLTNLTTKAAAPAVHAHVALGRRVGTAHGGAGVKPE